MKNALNTIIRPHGPPSGTPPWRVPACVLLSWLTLFDGFSKQVTNFRFCKEHHDTASRDALREVLWRHFLCVPGCWLFFSQIFFCWTFSKVILFLALLWNGYRHGGGRAASGTPQNGPKVTMKGAKRRHKVDKKIKKVVIFRFCAKV